VTEFFRIGGRLTIEQRVEINQNKLFPLRDGAWFAPSNTPVFVSNNIWKALFEFRSELLSNLISLETDLLYSAVRHECKRQKNTEDWFRSQFLTKSFGSKKDIFLRVKKIESAFW